MSDIKETLEETPPEVLRAFLARELAADSDLERRFHSFLNTSDLDVYELRDDIESKYGYQSGRARSTEDIDVLIEPIDEETTDELVAVLDTEGFIA